MNIWLIFIMLSIVLFFLIVWKRNWKVFFLSLSPLIYVIFDVYIECKATDNHSEACVWGYLNYLYAIVIGSVFYLTVTLFQVLISKFKKRKNSNTTDV